MSMMTSIRIISTLLLFVAVVGLSAQPTIQQITFVPGTTILLDSEFPITSEGAAGANATWDYSSLAFSGELYTYAAQAIATVPSVDQFPGATAAYSVDLAEGITGYFFFDHTGGIIDHGEVITGGGADLLIPYSDPQTHCITPIAFGGSGSDSFAFSTMIEGMNSSTTGTITWNVDAYGTLALPNAAYKNVLRVHAIANETSTTIVGGTPITTESQEETWRWFKAGYPLPLLTHSIISDEFGTEPGDAFAIISMTSPTGLDEGALPPLDVQPTPTNGTCTVRFPGAADPRMSVLYAAGQVIQEHGLNGSAPTVQVDFTGHALGAYVLEAYSLNGIQHTRIIHQ